MLGELLFSKTTLPVTLKVMDTGMLRARTIANNIANVNTPGYRRVEVSFEDALRGALDRTRLRGTQTDSRHIQMGKRDLSQVKAEAYEPADPTQPSGVNNVDIDSEMSKLAENQIMFNYGVKFAKGTFSKLNAAITGKSVPMQ